MPGRAELECIEIVARLHDVARGLRLGQENALQAAADYRREVRQGLAGGQRVDPYPERRAGVGRPVAKMLRDEVARKILARGCHGILEIEDNCIRPARFCLRDLSLAVAGNEEEGPDRRPHDATFFSMSAARLQ